VLALTRQAVPFLRTAAESENRSARGGYVLRNADGPRDVTLIATGSEVGLAVEAAGLLAQDGIKAAVVSMPGVEVFLAQDKSYRDEVLGDAPRVAIEAGIEMGWRRLLRPDDGFVGLSGFGASAPASALFEHFGLTAKRAAEVARGLAARN